MKRLLKIAALGLLLSPFSACFRKKAAIDNLQDWLDLHYPDRFQVLSTGPDDAIRNLSFKVKKSLVAEKSNPLVQAQLRWDKRQPNFSLSTAAVDDAFLQAQMALNDIQELNRLLKANGFDKSAVGSKNWTAIILLFETATPENRQQLSKRLEIVFEKWSKTEKYAKEILLMEPTSQDSLPGEILPLSYFLEGNSQYGNQAIFRLQLTEIQSSTTNGQSEEWEFNTSNEQFDKALENARSALDAWAKEHVKQPYFLMEVSEYEQFSEEPLLFRFKFPFTDKDHTDAISNSQYVEADGYFSMDFNMENNNAYHIEIIRE